MFELSWAQLNEILQMETLNLFYIKPFKCVPLSTQLPQSFRNYTTPIIIFQNCL